MAEEQSNEAGSKHKLSQEIHPIAIANDKSDEEFIRDYLKPRYASTASIVSTWRLSSHIHAMISDHHTVNMLT